MRKDSNVAGGKFVVTMFVDMLSNGSQARYTPGFFESGFQLSTNFTYIYKFFSNVQMLQIFYFTKSFESKETYFLSNAFKFFHLKICKSHFIGDTGRDNAAVFRCLKKREKTNIHGS